MGPSVDPDSSTIQVGGQWVGDGWVGLAPCCLPPALCLRRMLRMNTWFHSLCPCLPPPQELKEWAKQFGTSGSKQGLQSRRLSYFT